MRRCAAITTLFARLAPVVPCCSQHTAPFSGSTQPYPSESLDSHHLPYDTDCRRQSEGGRL